MEHVYKKILKKSCSRPVEFCGVSGTIEFKDNKVTLFNKVRCDIEYFTNNVGKFSFIENGKIYTNMRALLNAGIPYEYIPYNTPDELKDFKAIKCNIPMFVFAQLATHTAISKEAQSDRVSVNNNYWLPADFRSRVYDYSIKLKTIDDDINPTYFSILSKLLTDMILSYNNRDSIVNLLVNGDSIIHPTQTDTQMYFKELGYPQEIYSRAMYYFKYKEIVMTGWNNDPKAWKHLLVEREAYPELHTSWVQPETKQAVMAIKSIVAEYDSY